MILTQFQAVVLVAGCFCANGQTTTVLANGTVGRPYGPALLFPSFAPGCSVAGGQLPNGLFISNGGINGALPCYLEGTPTVAGTYSFGAITGFNPVPGPVFGSVSFEIQILPVQIPPSPPGGILGVSTGFLFFTVADSQVPTALNFSVTSTSGPQSYDVAVQYLNSAPANFISAAPMSGTATPATPGQVSVAVSSAVLQFSTGRYTANVNVSAGAQMQMVVVSVNVINPFPVSLALFPKSLNLTVPAGTKSTQTIQVENSVGHLLTGVSAGIQSSQGWCGYSGFDGSRFQVTVDASKLSPGTSNAAITFSPNGSSAAFAAVTLPVVANIVAPPVASPSSLMFSVTQGQKSPAGQTVSITTSDMTVQGFNITAPPFVTVSPLSGTASGNPAELTVSLNVGALNVGANSGNITVGLVSGGSTNIDVRATLTAAEPVINGAIFASSFGGFSTITSGGFVEIYGTYLAANAGDWGTSFVNGMAPTSLFGVKVQIDGKPAFVSYVSPGQVNVLAPDDLSVGGTVQVVLSNAGVTSAPFPVKAAALQPGLLAPANFKINGMQYVTAFLPDGKYALPTGAIGNSRPAKPGEVIVMYGLGFGPVSPDLATGTLETHANKLQNPLAMSFENIGATLQYDGLAPQYAGLYQFNVVVPTVPDNDAVPLTFNLGGLAGAQTLYLAVHQ